MKQAQSTVSVVESDIGRDVCMGMVEKLSIVYEHQFSMVESTWKHGYVSIDIDDLSFYLDYDSFPQ